MTIASARIRVTRGRGTIRRSIAHLGRYHEALECNQRALSIMDFGMARKQREFILAKIGSGSANG